MWHKRALALIMCGVEQWILQILDICGTKSERARMDIGVNCPTLTGGGDHANTAISREKTYAGANMVVIIGSMFIGCAPKQNRLGYVAVVNGPQAHSVSAEKIITWGHTATRVRTQT